MKKTTKSDYIDFDKCLNTGRKLMNSKKSLIGLYIIVSIHTGLRISDILKLRWKDLYQDDLILREKKTKITKIDVSKGNND